jgi:hypothetical protein
MASEVWVSNMDARMRESLDRHITGNYGEDQFRGYDHDSLDEHTEVTPTQVNGWSSWYCQVCQQYCASDNPCDHCHKNDRQR